MSSQPQIKFRHAYRPVAFVLDQCDLTFELDAPLTQVTAISQFKRTDPCAELRLDGEQLTLIALEINGAAWPNYRLEADQLILHNLPDEFTLKIVNHIHPATNSALEGLYQSGEALCTQCEAEGFRRITWFLDRPDVLTRFSTKIIADQRRYPVLLSNGNCVQQGLLADGRHWVKWQDPFPKPCYLFALVAGDFDLLRDTFVTRSGREVALEIYVDRGNLHRADWAMASLKASMRWDEQRFDLEYDLDIFMLVAVDFFNMGAMENKGLNIFNAKYVLASSETATDKDYVDIEAVIGHEYFHNWTGNRVTCRDWFQLSLKEGLTVFRDQEFSADLRSRAVNRINQVRLMRGAQFAEDASPMAHPIRPDQVIEMNNFYTLTVYEKGAEVIRMVHTLLGEVKFQQGMRCYFARHDGCAVTCDDFISAMEDASGVDLRQFRRWYSQSGTPILTIRDSYDQQRKQYVLQITQHTPPTADQPEKLPLHIPLAIALYDEHGGRIALQAGGQSIAPILNVTEATQAFCFEQVEHRPTPALLGEFSAPVKIDYPWREQQLTLLLTQAEDAFTRWDAAQSLLANWIKHNVTHYPQSRPSSLAAQVIDAFRHLLQRHNEDPALVAQIFTLPSENEIAELFTLVDPQAIAQVRRALQQHLAEALNAEFDAIYHAYKDSDTALTTAAMGKRALCHCCLHYLAFTERAHANRLVQAHYVNASTMTATLAALSAAVAAELPCQQPLLDAYEARWSGDPLVMDKWFTLQATSPAKDVLTRVTALMQHPAFSMANPNRVRALIGAFVSANPAAFHAADGSGYQFLLSILCDLNSRNPQIAARLIDPLIRYKRYDQQRQALMVAALNQLRQLDQLSNDLYEKIARALNETA